MKFTKMHGIGNDYVYVNGFAETVADPAQLAKTISDRHFGIGGDGLILILPSEKADVKMRMFNADGSEAEMCGNGIRCLAKYAHEHSLSDKNPLTVETGRGVLTLDLHLREQRVTDVTVNMGRPVLDLPKIPVDPGKMKKVGEHEYDFTIDGEEFSRHVRLHGQSARGDLHRRSSPGSTCRASAPRSSTPRRFPRRINVHWVQVE